MSSSRRDSHGPACASRADGGGFALDDFPANAAQAEVLDVELEGRSAGPLHHVISLEGRTEDDLVERVLSSRVHGRATDFVYHLANDPPPKASERFDVIHGEEDRHVPPANVPPANARALAEAIPGAKLRLLEDAGHLVFVERFADVNRELVRFLKSSEARARSTGGGAAEAASREPEGWLRRSMRAVRDWNARMKALVRVF